MRLAVVIGFSLLLSFQHVTAQEHQHEISEEDVARIITVLSADDMEGRRTFTPGVEKASRFIEGEFEKIGLEPLEGLNDYRQSFVVYALTPGKKTIAVNGEEVPDSHLLVSANSAVIKWDLEDVNIINVGPDDDLRQVVGTRRRSTDNAVVIVDLAHREQFNRYQQFFSGPTRTMELMEEGNTVFIMSAEKEVDSVQIEVTSHVEEMPLNNVAGKITGKRSDEIVLFSAHYDHIGIRRAVEGDSIGNGANDNASGTTAVIMLAKYFRALGVPERTLMFVAFTAEEMGGYGSSYYSQKVNPDEIVAMFNIEMIGKPATDGPNSAWITGFDRSTFGEILQESVKGTEYTFYPDPYPTQNLFYRSDNATLARLGVPAHSISTTPIDVDPDYHQVSDEVETLDLEHLTNTIRAITKGAATIVSGEATPTRVDVNTVN